MSREPCDVRRRGSVARGGLTAGLAALVLAVPALAGEPVRIDLYDTKSNRTGYAIVDRETGRVDTYDANSRRTGWGRVDPSGRAERFDLEGRRQEPTAFPLGPGPKRSPKP